LNQIAQARNTLKEQEIATPFVGITAISATMEMEVVNANYADNSHNSDYLITDEAKSTTIQGPTKAILIKNKPNERKLTEFAKEEAITSASLDKPVNININNAAIAQQATTASEESKNNMASPSQASQRLSTDSDSEGDNLFNNFNIKRSTFKKD
jgi:hypothetical protein